MNAILWLLTNKSWTRTMPMNHRVSYHLPDQRSNYLWLISSAFNRTPSDSLWFHLVFALISVWFSHLISLWFLRWFSLLRWSFSIGLWSPMNCRMNLFMECSRNFPWTSWSASGFQCLECSAWVSSCEETECRFCGNFLVNTLFASTDSVIE